MKIGYSISSGQPEIIYTQATLNRISKLYLFILCIVFAQIVKSPKKKRPLIWQGDGRGPREEREGRK